MKGYRTLIFNAIMAIVAFANTLAGEPVDTSSTLEALTSLEFGILGLWAIGNMVLRVLTNTAVLKSE